MQMPGDSIKLREVTTSALQRSNQPYLAKASWPAAIRHLAKNYQQQLSWHI